MAYGPKQQANQMVPMMIQEGKMGINPLAGQSAADLKGDVLGHVKGLFPEDTFQVPQNATRTVYVQGIPYDATEREVSRKSYRKD